MSIKTYLRLSASLIILSSLLALASCENAATPSGDVASALTQETTIAPAATETETETGNARENAKDSLPDGLDFKNNEFTILCRSEDAYKIEFDAQSQTGQILNDAVYYRNLVVEERLNVKLNIVTQIGNYPNQDQFLSVIRKEMKADMHDYDMFVGFAAYLPNLATEGCYLNLHELDYIDLSAPWWNQSIVEDYTIKGKLYVLTGDIAPTLLSHSIVFFFNKNMAEARNIPDLYQTVLDGNWTLDKMREISADIYDDVDGNGVKDETDKYGLGFTMNSQCDAFLASCDIPITAHDEDGKLTLGIPIERLENVNEKLYKTFFETNGVYAPVVSTEAVSNSMRTRFSQGCYLLHANTLRSVELDLADMTDSYGIIPYPKYDENQEKYQTFVWNQFSMISVPSNASDLKFSGAVIEALASESYRTVTPKYFDQALKLRYSQDESSGKMLDIINDGITLNFGYLYSSAVFILRDSLRNDLSPTLMSKYNASEKLWKAQINALMKSYDKLQ